MKLLVLKDFYLGWNWDDQCVVGEEPVENGVLVDMGEYMLEDNPDVGCLRILDVRGLPADLDHRALEQLIKNDFVRVV